MATKSESEILSAFARIYEANGMTNYDPCLKGKYLVPSALRTKTIKRTKAGNSGSMTKAQKRMPRVPAPRGCKGSEGWKPWMEPVRHPWKAKYK